MLCVQLDYSDEEEVHTIIDEVETVAGHVESASYAGCELLTCIFMSIMQSICSR